MTVFGALGADSFSISESFGAFEVSATVEATTCHRSCIGPRGHAAWDQENQVYYSFTIIPGTAMGDDTWAESYPGKVMSVQPFVFENEYNAQFIRAVDHHGTHHLYLVVELTDEEGESGILVAGIEMTDSAFDAEKLQQFAEDYFESLHVTR